MKLKVLTVLLLTVTVSGCTDSVSDSSAATLVGEVSDRTIAEDSPGEIKINAENTGNQTYFYTVVKPIGDYSEIVTVTDRNGNPQRRVDLGDAVKGATTGEKFAQVRKDLNVTSSVKIKVELYEEGSEEVLDTETYILSTKEG